MRRVALLPVVLASMLNAGEGTSAVTVGEAVVIGVIKN